MGRIKKIIFTDLSCNQSISLTGLNCALNCLHCNKKFLQSMKKLQDRITPLTKSLLISGGCDRNGKVPILDFSKEIRKLKLKYKINAHVGLVSNREAKKISPLVDVVSFDFINQSKIIKKIYKLDKKVKDYYQSLLALKKFTKVFPHLTLGLWKGQISWEYKAVEILVKKFEFHDIVFNIFIPVAGTKLEKQKPPSIREIKKYFLFLSKNYPQLTKRLGCMRPGGKYRRQVDKIALLTNFKIITKPCQEVVTLAKNKNYKIVFKHECCIF